MMQVGGWSPFRRFLLMSCALFVALSLAGAALEARYLESTALALAEREGTFLGRHLGALYFRPGVFLNSAGELEIPHPLLETVVEELKSLDIVMLKVYDLHGKIVAATDPSYIGMDKGDNPTFQAALAGKTAGKVATRKYYRNLYGRDSTEDLFELYIPLWSPGRSSPVVILEIYRPWSLYDPLIHAGIVRTGIVAAVLTVLYCLLLLLFIRRIAQMAEKEVRGVEPQRDAGKARPPGRSCAPGDQP